jgi:hypothetical protein
MAGSDSRLFQLHGSDSFSLRESTAQEAESLKNEQLVRSAAFHS